MIEKRAFGRTGHASTRTLFGGAALSREELETMVKEYNEIRSAGETIVSKKG